MRRRNVRKKRFCRIGGKQTACLLAAAAAVWISPLQNVQAAEAVPEAGLEDAVWDGESEGLPAALADGVIDYEDLEELAASGNVTLTNARSSSEALREAYEEDMEYLESERAWAARHSAELEDEGELEEAAEYTAYRAVYRGALDGYRDMIRRLDGYSANKTTDAMEKQIVKGAQSLMISYQALSLQKENSEQTARLYERQCEDAGLRWQAGTGTEQEMRAARDAAEEARLSVLSMEEQMESVYDSLCLLLGIDPDGSVAVGAVPEAELGAAQTADVAADTKKAIDNNTDIIETRNSSEERSTRSREKRDRSLRELEQQITGKMEELSQEWKQAETALEAARTGYEAASITWENACRKYEMGMLDSQEYIREELNYVQKKNALEQAKLSLFQAQEIYEWAVNGILDLEE